MNFSYNEFKSKIIFFFGGGGEGGCRKGCVAGGRGRGARVCEFFYEVSNLKKKILFFFGGGGGGGGGGWREVAGKGAKG